MAAKRASQRFTTLDGWREIGQGVYTATGSGIRIITVNTEFDAEPYYFNAPSRTRPGNLNATSIYHPPTQSGIYPPEVGLTAGQVIGTPINLKNPYFGVPVVPEKTTQGQSEPPYHVFSRKQKWVLVCIIGVAGLFSGLSSNIYFPSLERLRREKKDLHVGLDTVSLTITSYLIIQGISPLFWGSLSDILGRRPIYIYSFSLYIVANIALSFSPNFAMLLIFRGVQAAGSASTVSIGNGVIQDITPIAERGGFISFYQAIRNFSIAIGPVLGGLLAGSFGFRSIFVFLLILSALVLGLIIVYLPETLRSIAGNGSLRLKGIHQPLIRKFKKEPPYMVDPDENFDLPKVALITFVKPVKLLMEKDVLTSLIFGGVVYAIWSMVTSSTTSLFKERYHLNELLLGLAFLPNGLGTIVGSTIIGKLMNRDYAFTESEYKSFHSLPEGYKLSKKDLPDDFPIERARLRNLWWIVVVFILSTSIYGWTLAFPAFTAKPGSIAVPLLFQFYIAATSNAIFAVNQTLVSDLCPGNGASSTAINNLVRCTLGAVGVAFIEKMIASLGVGPSFLGLGLITVACVPFLVAEWYLGMGWRASRAERVKEREKVKEERQVDAA
ncbi:hypothetical protein OIDMADRAFT_132862 [Oidiodendron maius Zn]|uniref:Major facilitator superfamily (MFS) profile domain-containing protein n=1 Tax=Oidiodendron maius (strain Zn) TaxID=913774 RepID=A0A0C3GX73_OIDMZ|nr:hypothetical protein OIDMADRAFT_132862 [Oidiodendron maius Zn]